MTQTQIYNQKRMSGLVANLTCKFLNGMSVSTDDNWVSHLTSSQELNLFGLGSNTVETLISPYLNNSVPTSIFYNDPTTAGNSFADNFWSPLITIIRGFNATLVSQKTVTMNSYPQFQYNGGFNIMQYTPSNTSLPVVNTIQTSWDKNASQVSKSQVIGISINLQQNDLTTAFDHKWGAIVKSATSKNLTCPQQTISVPSQQYGIANFTYDQTEYVFQFDYEVSLEGNVLAYFQESLNGSNVWNKPIFNIQYAGKLPTTFIISQTVTIRNNSNLQMTLSTSPNPPS